MFDDRLRAIQEIYEDDSSWRGWMEGPSCATRENWSENRGTEVDAGG